MTLTITCLSLAAPSLCLITKLLAVCGSGLAQQPVTGGEIAKGQQADKQGGMDLQIGYGKDAQGRLNPVPNQQTDEVGYDGGFFIRDEATGNELVIEGLFQVGLNLYQKGTGKASEFDLRRARLEFAGRFADHYRFRFEPKFQSDSVELEEAWIGVEFFDGEDILMLGRMKAPFGLEEMRSRRWTHFPRFSVLNRFSPAEDLGAYYFGRPLGSDIEYGIAIYNGAGIADNNSSKDLAMRLNAPLFAHNMRFGIAATYGRQDDDVGGSDILNASDLPFLTWSSGAMLDGDRMRVGLEFSWYDGPFMVQSEYLYQSQEMHQGAGPDNDIHFSGFYVDAAYVLTGESISFKGVQPNSVFQPNKPSAFDGAWILALRYSVQNSDDDILNSGLATAGNFTSRMQSLSLGLNRVLGRNFLIRHSLQYHIYSDDLQRERGLVGDEVAFLVEFQLHF